MPQNGEFAMSDAPKNRRLLEVPESEISLAGLGLGEVAYVRKIDAHELEDMIGQELTTSPAQPFYCLYQADGTPMSVSDSREAALANAYEHDLAAISVH
jgi:hypothetical protein